jgi:hypothetical protein
MDADAFVRQYTAEQIRAILGHNGSNKNSPMIFALSALAKEKSEGGSLLGKRFLPVLTTRGEGFDKYTNSQIILSLSLLGSSPESELFLLSRSYCSSEKDKFRSGEFYLLEKTGEMELDIDGGISPHYMRLYLGLEGVPEILKRQMIGNFRISGIFEFPEMLENKKLFYKKLLDSMPGEFEIWIDDSNSLLESDLKLSLHDLATPEIEADLFRITQESTEKYISDKNVEGFIKVGKELAELVRLEKGSAISC